jgi:hypothetical protein
MIEYLHSHLKETEGASPDFFVGTLEEEVSAAMHSVSIEDVRLRLY